MHPVCAALMAEQPQQRRHSSLRSWLACPVCCPCSAELHSGHYTAFCRVPGAPGDGPGSWHCYDDQRVSRMEQGGVVTPDAYVLIFQRQGTARLDDSEALQRAAVAAVQEQAQQDADRRQLWQQWQRQRRQGAAGAGGGAAGGGADLADLGIDQDLPASSDEETEDDDDAWVSAPSSASWGLACCAACWACMCPFVRRPSMTMPDPVTRRLFPHPELPLGVRCRGCW